MSRIAYRSINFRAERRLRIEQAEEILADYEGMRLTSRQVYYQFVARGFIENEQRSYKLVTSLLADARYAGIIDWDVIEDRGREPDTRAEWDSIEDLVDSALRSFRLPRWATQKCYVELWVEKQALAGVLAPLAREYHVTLMVNKGYSSASAMKASADRMIEACGFTSDAVQECRYHCENDDELQASKPGSKKYNALMRDYTDRLVALTRAPIVFYLGDHDPSGEDMVRDVETRLKEFGVERLTVSKLAITMDQIRRFNPVPNPAKLSDSRAAAYIRKYGNESWELDALPPRELTRIIRRAFSRVIDQKAYDAIVAQEEQLKEHLRDVAGDIT